MFLIMLPSSKSGVASSWCRQICVCGSTFLHAGGQPAIGILSNWSLKIQNEVPPYPLSMNWAELHFQPLEHLRSGVQGEKD